MPRQRESLSLAANAPLVARLAEETLCEIEPFLCFCQLLPEALDTLFKSLEPRPDVRRWRFGTRDAHTSDLDRRESNDRHHWYEWGKVHVPSSETPSTTDAGPGRLVTRRCATSPSAEQLLKSHDWPACHL